MNNTVSQSTIKTICSEFDLNQEYLHLALKYPDVNNLAYQCITNVGKYNYTIINNDGLKYVDDASICKQGDYWSIITIDNTNIDDIKQYIVEL